MILSKQLMFVVLFDEIHLDCRGLSDFDIIIDVIREIRQFKRKIMLILSKPFLAGVIVMMNVWDLEIS
jgi:hypothetical protein